MAVNASGHIRHVDGAVKQRKQESMESADRPYAVGPSCRAGIFKNGETGKRTFFEPLVGRDEYLQYETQSFVKQYYGGSRLNLINTLYQGEGLSGDEIDELVKWVNDQRKK